jgi:large subunit ribosomal protein L14
VKALFSKMGRPIPIGASISTCDNSGAKILNVFGVKNMSTVKGRLAAAGIGDLVIASVSKGRPDMRKTVVQAVIVRQKKEFKRPDGTRVKFEDNAAVVIKDDFGNPKGTLIKGAIPKEVTTRWPAIAKLASIVV